MKDDHLPELVAERAVEELYSFARMRPTETRGALALAKAVLGESCIRVVPRTSIPKEAVLVSNRGRDVIHLREGLTKRQMNHSAAHELGEWHLRMRGYRGPEQEELARRIAAAICVPRGAFHAARETFGDDIAALSRAFLVSESLMALRVGECVGLSTALITPRRIRIRGASWAWPSTPEDWRDLVHAGPARGLVVHRVRDARGRLVLRRP